ncbi:DUF3263 domain-containing protein [Streptacidiphilus sp. MAP5-3]|uniref:DUF3263 domain-containing protein n=1 Tax=unclassified Streptacidiphilus TaxID=2643834 RepID=UPI003515D87F
MGDELDEHDRALLRFEARAWRSRGAKDAAIREELGYSPTRYTQLLNSLLDREAALAFDPVLVNRLRRIREQKRQRR